MAEQDLARLARFWIAHNSWAIGRLLEECARLSGADFDRDLGIGPGSLRVNIGHTIDAMFFFADNFAGRKYEQRPDFDRLATTIEGLAELNARATRELREAMVAALSRELPDRIGWPSSDAGSMSGPAAMAQVFDHATLHRTQCINMLKRLGVPPPDLDPMSFEATGTPW